MFEKKGTIKVEQGRPILILSQCPQTLVDEINLRNFKKLDSPLSI